MYNDVYFTQDWIMVVSSFINQILVAHKLIITPFQPILLLLNSLLYKLTKCTSNFIVIINQYFIWSCLISTFFFYYNFCWLHYPQFKTNYNVDHWFMNSRLGYVDFKFFKANSMGIFGLLKQILIQPCKL